MELRLNTILLTTFALIAFTEREKVNDVLLSSEKGLSIDSPDREVTIGTSSVRRVAMLKHFYPHVEAVEMRGNLQTRIKKMDAGDCAGIRSQRDDPFVAEY